MKKILIHFLTSAAFISIPLTSLTISMYTVTTIAKAAKKLNGVQATTPLLRLIKQDL